MILPRPLRILFYPLSLLYKKAVLLRTELYETGRFKAKRLGGAVISVGNLTVGGTGKTPMVLWLAEKFLAQGKRVAILSRGYRGSGGTSDEIELLRHRLRNQRNQVDFGIGRDRFATGRKLELRQPVDIFILDDGYQHLGLARDLNILMLDGSVKLKDEWVLPAGVLREPISACGRANIIVITRGNETRETESQFSQKCLIFHAHTRLLGFRFAGNLRIPSYLSEIGPGPFFAFCGIGNPESFWSDLARWRIRLVGQRRFRDHHRYSSADVERLEQAADQVGARALITTEKDEQNLKEARLFKLPVYIAVIDFVLSPESEFLAAVDRTLSTRQGAVA